MRGSRFVLAEETNFKNVKFMLKWNFMTGDQILEWNGIDLSDKTYEEVQTIICQPNGEIELVVRP